MFTEEETQLLFDALDALESEDAMRNIMVTMFGVGLSEDKDAYMAKREQEMKNAEQKNRVPKERIIVLKAKMIQMMRNRKMISNLDFE